MPRCDVKMKYFIQAKIGRPELAQVGGINGDGNRPGKRENHPSILSVERENGCLKVAGYVRDTWVGL